MDYCSLLSGPQVFIEHDEKLNGVFNRLAGPYTISLLRHFSTAIDQQIAHHTSSVNLTHHQSNALPDIPQTVRVSGGIPSALKDLFYWMRRSARSDEPVAFHLIVRDPVQLIFIASSVQNLGVQSLKKEVWQLLRRLQTNALTVGQIKRVIAAPAHGVLPEMRRAIVISLAKRFHTARLSLSEVKSCFDLATMNGGFDLDMLHALNNLRDSKWTGTAGHAHYVWLNKNIDQYKRDKSIPYIGTSHLRTNDGSPYPGNYVLPPIPMDPSQFSVIPVPGLQVPTRPTLFGVPLFLSGRSQTGQSHDFSYSLDRFGASAQPYVPTTGYVRPLLANLPQLSLAGFHNPNQPSGTISDHPATQNMGAARAIHSQAYQRRVSVSRRVRSQATRPASRSVPSNSMRPSHLQPSASCMNNTTTSHRCCLHSYNRESRICDHNPRHPRRVHFADQLPDPQPATNRSNNTLRTE